MKLTNKLLDAIEVQVEPFAICDVRCGSYLEIQPDDTNTVHYMLAGYGSLSTGNGETISLKPDQMILIPPGISQRIESDAKSGRRNSANSICLQPIEGLHWLQSGAGVSDVVLVCGKIRVTCGQAINIFSMLQHPVVESFEDSAFIRSSFETMLSEFGNPKLGTLTLASTLMKQCLIFLLRRLYERQDWRIPWLSVLDDSRMGDALNAMINNPEKNYRVEDLANLACMSRSTFTDHFSKLFGCPPHEFLTSYRLKRAAHLLTTGSLSVEIIADRVGYQSRSSFSRAFKSLYGKDPATYRKMPS